MLREEQRNCSANSRALACSQVAVLLLPGFSIGEFAQIADALTFASFEMPRRLTWGVYGLEEGQTESSAAINVLGKSVNQLRRNGVSVLLLGPRPREAGAWSKLASAVRFCWRHNGFVAGIGDAVEILAELGLLSGKKACMPWNARLLLQEQHSNIQLSEGIFTLDGVVATCAGGAATVDFALEFVAIAYSPEVADRVAKRMMTCSRRAGDRSQRIGQLAHFANARSAFLSAIETIHQSGNDRLDIGRMAAAAGVSPRQLQRLFKRYLQISPTSCLRAHRLKQAKELLTRTPMTIAEVALASGFENPTNFARRYSRAFGRTPSADRRTQWSQD
jgi:AraC family carnitine catabolism transcriptional activator